MTRVYVKGSVLDAIAAVTTYLPEGITIGGIGQDGNENVILDLVVPEGMDISADLVRWYASDDVGDLPGGRYPEWSLIHYSESFAPFVQQDEGIFAPSREAALEALRS